MNDLMCGPVNKDLLTVVIPGSQNVIMASCKSSACFKDSL